MIVAQEKEEVESAWNQYYSQLAKFMEALADSDNSTVLEAGCGNGALTSHLLSLNNYSKYICYDLYSGVYTDSLQEILERKLNVDIVMGDVREMSFRSNTIDTIFSNELLCDLTRNDARKAVAEFYRILKDGGIYVHGVLSPYPENRAQELVILADQYSAEPIFPSEWFSPPADELAGLLHQEGFSSIGVRYFDESLRFEGDCVFEILKEWVIMPEFFDYYTNDLRECGLELPLEQVIYCRK
jgi:SAM-dependent methyltransferase